jgi:hypothetical protein
MESKSSATERFITKPADPFPGPTSISSYSFSVQQVKWIRFEKAQQVSEALEGEMKTKAKQNWKRRKTFLFSRKAQSRFENEKLKSLWLRFRRLSLSLLPV